MGRFVILVATLGLSISAGAVPTKRPVPSHCERECEKRFRVCHDNNCVQCTRDEHCFSVCHYCDPKAFECRRRRFCCTDNADCPTGFCSRYRGHRECDPIGCHEASYQCGPGLVCRDTFCQPGPDYYEHFPRPRPGGCTKQFECSAKTKLCVQGKCRTCDPRQKGPPCGGSDCHRCTKNFTCVQIKGCCTQNSQCSSGTHCRVTPGKPTGVCEKNCRTHKDCKKGTRCQLGMCL